jgi:hypothetical protein
MILKLYILSTRNYDNRLIIQYMTEPYTPICTTPAYWLLEKKRKDTKYYKTAYCLSYKQAFSKENQI